MSASGDDFVTRLTAHGFDFFAGVPCSLLGAVHRALESRTDLIYVESTREDEAVGQASGAFLAGRKPVVLMQNSGLGNSLNALASLTIPYEHALLLVITWRGFEGKDAPEHIVMGDAMTRILDSLPVPWQVYDPLAFDRQLDQVDRHFAERCPSALLVHKGLLELEA